MRACAVCGQCRVGEWYTPIPEPDGYTCPWCLPAPAWWRWTWMLAMAVFMDLDDAAAEKALFPKPTTGIQP